MNEMTKTDLQLFKTIAQMKQSSLLKTLPKLLLKYYSKDKIIVTKDYILCGEGDIPIMLTAHMDTVFKSPPSKIYYDTKQKVMWSPQGLGADDRAGIFAILKILQKGYRPAICFTTDEERGSLGAMKLIKDFKTSPFYLKYIIELDRRGMNDCVFYSCDNDLFTEYVESFEFVTNWGTFSDISTICPEWGIAGVNLSVGYLDEHSVIETLNTCALYSTIGKVQEMLDDHEHITPFEYVADFPSLYSNVFEGYNFDKQRLYQCCSCRKIFSGDDVFPVKSKSVKNAIKYYCIDCVADKVNWCVACGEPFEVQSPADTLCPDCAGIDLPQTFIY